MNQPLLNDAVEGWLREFSAFPPTILVAVSGGLDSIVLLHALTQTQAHVVAVHVNHGLRGTESDADMQFVQDVCNSYGVQVFVSTVNVLHRSKLYHKSIEMAARDARYEVFNDVAERIGAHGVALAHHADDVAETMLMNLCRGRGLAGLRGIPASRSLPCGALVFRPFLVYSKSHLLEYALRHRLTWREDSTNTSSEFQRNRIRNEVLPILKNIYGNDVSQQFAASASIVSEAQEILSTSVYAQHAHRNTFLDNGQQHINIQNLEQHNQQVIRGVFAMFCNSRHDVQLLETLLFSDVGTQASLEGSRTALRDRNAILISPPNIEQPPSHSVALEAPGLYNLGSQTLGFEIHNALDVQPQYSNSVAYLDAASVHGQLRWRTWQHADRITPFGSENSTKVSDVLTNAKVGSWNKKFATVVEDDKGIVWLCGLRTAERCRITHATERIIVLQWP